MRQIVYKIERFDGKKSYTQEYSFAHEPNKTVLWGLMKIQETLDATLAFSASCRSAVCGACAMRINGQAMLACETSLDGTLNRFGDTVSIAPLKNFKIVKDLVVDWEDKAERLVKVMPWLKPHHDLSPDKDCVQTPEERSRINAQVDCILCGACASACNKLSADCNDFYEPYAYTKAQRFVGDSRDTGEKEHMAAVLDQGLWRCVHCQQCVTQCPKHVEPAEDIARLRRRSIQMGETDNTGARHALAFCDDLMATGRLDEAKMAIKTEGIFKSATRVPFALRLLSKGKLNPLHMLTAAPVKNIQQIRSIIETIKGAEK